MDTRHRTTTIVVDMLYFVISVNALMLPLQFLEQELLTPPEHLSLPTVLNGVRVTRSLVLCVCFVDRSVSFFVSPLCCLFFFDIWILITPLVSSNSS